MTSWNARPLEATIEDLTWLADSGVGLTEAAERTGFRTAKNLDKWMRRHHLEPLIARLVAHEPCTLTPSQKAS